MPIRYFYAGDRTWTGTVLPPRDFKSLASADFATPAYCFNSPIIIYDEMWIVKIKNEKDFIFIVDKTKRFFATLRMTFLYGRIIKNTASRKTRGTKITFSFII